MKPTLLPKIYLSLWFDTNAQDAAKQYMSIFPDSKMISASDLVTVFELTGARFQAINGGPAITMNPSISLYCSLKSADEVQAAWNTLIKGGKSLMEIGSYPWAQKYGWVQDMYGLSWQLSYSGDAKPRQAIVPTLMFGGVKAGLAADAIRLYTSIFPDSEISSLTHYEQGDGDKPELLKNAQFHISGYEMMAMDSSYPHEFDFSDGISFVVECNTQEEIDYYWEKLTQNGGKEVQCGWLKDTYGVSWQIIPAMLGKLMSTGDAEKSKRVMNALMKMVKIDISTLENA